MPSTGNYMLILNSMFVWVVHYCVQLFFGCKKNQTYYIISFSFSLLICFSFFTLLVSFNLNKSKLNKSKLKSIESKLKSIESQLKSIKSKLKAIKSKLKSIESQLKVNWFFSFFLFRVRHLKKMDTIQSAKIVWGGSLTLIKMLH